MSSTPTTARPSLAAIAEAGGAAAVAPIRSARAGRVVAWDADANTADVQLVHDEVVTGTDGAPRVAPAPIVYGKPVAMMAGGGSAFTIGLSEGDPVWVIFRDVSHDEYDAGRTGGTYAPQDPTRWRPADAIVWPFARPPARADGAPVLAMGSGDAFRVGALDADEPVGMATALREELDALWSAMATHTHQVALVQPGAATIASNPSGTTPDTRDIASRRLLTDDTVTTGVGVVG